MEIIKSEIELIKNKYNRLKQSNLTDDQAFEMLMSYYFYYNEKGEFENCLYDIESGITNGSNDGGIDFVFYDEDNSKIILAQCKYSSNFGLGELISELNKMSTTVNNFQKSNTGIYNNKLKKVLQNAIDRLPEENEGNVEYAIFSLSNFDKKNLQKKIKSEINIYSSDDVVVYSLEDIRTKIEEETRKINVAPEFKIKIDIANNYLSYHSNDADGIMVNMSSISLTQMYNKYKDDGLLDRNIRKFVPNKNVDEGLEKSLNSNRENFWFLNNGLIIACNDFEVDGNTVYIEKFSIVNGGQTTYKIGTYNGSNQNEFFIPCKIIKVNDEKECLHGQIAEATNSQKPISTRDLKSNSMEMKTLNYWLKNEKIYLEIKRGVKFDKNKFDLKIKNDELGQCILSFVYQQPGTARSGKKLIFENELYYNKIFKQKYENDINKKEFIVDLIKLYKDYLEIESKLKLGDELSLEQKVILSNAKCIIFAIFGMSYYVKNNDITINSIKSDSSILNTTGFVYSKFISNYTDDDYRDKLKAYIVLIVYLLESAYNTAVNEKSVTSISNLFKTDKKYKENVIKSFVQNTSFGIYKDQFNEFINLFSRN